MFPSRSLIHSNHYTLILTIFTPENVKTSRENSLCWSHIPKNVNIWQQSCYWCHKVSFYSTHFFSNSTRIVLFDKRELKSFKIIMFAHILSCHLTTIIKNDISPPTWVHFFSLLSLLFGLCSPSRICFAFVAPRRAKRTFSWQSFVSWSILVLFIK